MKSELFNPLDYANLTRHVVLELRSQEPVRLPLATRFSGPGVYALYYTGPFDPYRRFTSPEFDAPIYVGCAELAGRRKGSKSATDAGKSRALYGRIKDHEGSIAAVSNLEVHDFAVRYLAVVPLWITMAERFLIEHYRPLWNVCLEGFGLHDPGKGRHAGLIPWWDAMHEGREWAARLRQERTQSDAIARVRTFTPAKPEMP